MNNLIPEKLIGKSAVPFLEYCYQIKNEHTKRDLASEKNAVNNALFNVYEAMRFYNQPFSADMLCNTIERPEVIDQYGIEEKLWQQAKEKVLFEGWELSETMRFKTFTNNKHKIVWSNATNSIFTLNSKMMFVREISLNDFITLCNLAGISLTFKK